MGRLSPELGVLTGLFIVGSLPQLSSADNSNEFFLKDLKTAKLESLVDPDELTEISVKDKSSSSLVSSNLFSAYQQIMQDNR